MGRLGAAQQRPGAGRTVQLALRDASIPRTAHDHRQSRAHARRDDGSGDGNGPPVPEAVLRQGQSGGRAAGVDPVFLPDLAAGRRAVLVSGRRGGLRRDLDGRRRRPGAERVRRDGLPGDGEGRLALLRSARSRERRHEDRFPGRSELVSLRRPLHDVAGQRVLTREARAVDLAQARQPRLLHAPVPAGVRPIARVRVGGLDRVRAEVPGGQPRGDSQASGHGVHRPVVAGAGLGFTRVLRRPHEHHLRRAQLPRRRGACRRHFHEDRRRPASRRHQGAEDLPGRLARVGRRGHAVLHDRQRRVSRSRQARHRDRPDRRAAEGRAHRRSRHEPGGQVALGHPAPARHRVDRADGAALSRMDAHRLAAVRDRGLRSRHLARRHAGLGERRRSRRPAKRPRLRPGRPGEGRRHAVGRVRLRRHGGPEQLHVLIRRPLPVRQLVHDRRLEHLSIRDRHQVARSGDQHGDRLLPPDSARRRRAARLPVHGRGLRPGAPDGAADSRPRRRLPSWANGRSRSIPC